MHSHDGLEMADLRIVQVNVFLLDLDSVPREDHADKRALWGRFAEKEFILRGEPPFPDKSRSGVVCIARLECSVDAESYSCI